jgi:outer membrane protein assembly factor BamB
MDHSRRRFLRRVGLGGSALLTGCSSAAPRAEPDATGGRQVDRTAFATFRGDLRRTGYYPGLDVPTSVTRAWEVPGVNTGTHTAAKASAVPHPDGGYVVPGDSGTVYCLRADGSVRWRAETEPSQNGVHGTPTVANGLVYVGAYDGALYAFDAATGERVWRRSLGDAIGSSPAYHDGTVYVAVEFYPPSGAVFGVDALTGTVTWRDPAPTDHPHSTIAIDREGGRLVVGSNDGVLYGWSYPDLERVWKAPTGGAIKGPIAVADGAAVFGSWDDRVYRVDLATGAVDWTFDTGNRVMGGAAINPDAGRVYIGGHDQRLHALSLATGEERWAFPTGGWIIGAATLTRAHVLVGSYDGTLYAVRTADGTREWAASVRGHVSSDPLVTEEGVVFAERATRERDGRVLKLVASN